MAHEADPIEGNWYAHLDKGGKFTVVAVDEAAGTVELQHFDGDLEEVELETWYEMEIERVEEPEDWSGAMDLGEADERGFGDGELDEAWFPSAEETPAFDEEPDEGPP